ncbi:MAG: PCRF domain-containing protein [Thermoleophilia bacterium]
MLAEDDDPDIRALLREAEDELEQLEPSIREAMIEPDPNDDKDVIVEIRAAAGGDEAALFARDLMEIYARYAEQRSFKLEPLSTSPSDAGGLRDVTFAVKGTGAYSVFKHEAGVHRVQRVPTPRARGASTPPRRRSRCSPRSRTSTSRSTSTTSASTCTAPVAPGGRA